MVFILDSFFSSKSYISNVKVSSAVNERDDLLVQVCNSAFPRAPWDMRDCVMFVEGTRMVTMLCCEINVIPSIVGITWILQFYEFQKETGISPPAFVASLFLALEPTGESPINTTKKRNLGEFSCKCLEERSRLAKLMEMKEHWEFTVEEVCCQDFSKFKFCEKTQ